MVGIAVNLHGDRRYQQEIDPIPVIRPGLDLPAVDGYAPSPEELQGFLFEDAGVGRSDNAAIGEPVYLDAREVRVNTRGDSQGGTVRRFGEKLPQPSRRLVRGDRGRAGGQAGGHKALLEGGSRGRGPVDASMNLLPLSRREPVLNLAGRHPQVQDLLPMDHPVLLSKQPS
jgi:hypothetical protein